MCGRLENVDQLGWLFSQLEGVDRQEIGQQEFSVTWTGLVRAPADGTYTFSICPLDLNYAHEGTFRRQTMAIWVGKEQILNATADVWTSEATPVALSAAAAVPLRVELTYACTSGGVIDDRPAVAMLDWQAPGLAKQLVPTSALTTPDGSQSGLAGGVRAQSQRAGRERHARRPAGQFHLVPPVLCRAWERDALRKNLADQFLPWPPVPTRWLPGNRTRKPIPSAGRRTGPSWKRSTPSGSSSGPGSCWRIRRWWPIAPTGPLPISIAAAASAHRQVGPGRGPVGPGACR